MKSNANKLQSLCKETRNRTSKNEEKQEQRKNIFVIFREEERIDKKTNRS